MKKILSKKILSLFRYRQTHTSPLYIDRHHHHHHRHHHHHHHHIDGDQVKALRILPTPTARPNAPDLYSHARFLLDDQDNHLLWRMIIMMMIMMILMIMMMNLVSSDRWWFCVTLRAPVLPLCPSPLFPFSLGSRCGQSSYFTFSFEKVGNCHDKLPTFRQSLYLRLSVTNLFHFLVLTPSRAEVCGFFVLLTKRNCDSSQLSSVLI